MGKIGQNPKIGQLLRPVALQSYIVEKSWPNLGNSLAPGLQRGVCSISLQCIPWPVSCSEWVPVRPIFNFRFWWQMTPKVKIFKNDFPDSATGHRNTFRDQIWWKSATAKLSKGRVVYHTKTSRSAGLVPAPILPKIGRSRPKLPERCHPFPLTCPRITNLVRIGYVLPNLFQKDWFFGPKSQYFSLQLLVHSVTVKWLSLLL